MDEFELGAKNFDVIALTGSWLPFINPDRVAGHDDEAALEHVLNASMLGLL